MTGKCGCAQDMGVSGHGALVAQEEFVAQSGLTYRQLDVWTNRGLLVSVNPGCGSGTRRMWPLGEVEVARVMSVLVGAGIRPAAAERAARNGGVLAPGVWVIVKACGVVLGEDVVVDCEIGGDRCTNQGVLLVEDPYEADVNNTPGVMVWMCAACLYEVGQDI